MSLGEFACATCPRVLAIEQTTGGAQPKVVLLIVGQVFAMVCEDCGKVVCNYCQAEGFKATLICKHCGGALEKLGIAADPFAPPKPEPDWQAYVSGDGAFALAYPPAVLTETTGVSRDAAFALASPDGRALVEVMRLQLGPPGSKHAVDVVADVFAQHLFDEPGYSNGRVVSRGATAPGDAERALRLVVAFREHGVDFTSSYVIFGTGRNVIYVALKTPTADREVYRETFETIVRTLRAASLATHPTRATDASPTLDEAPTQPFAAIVPPTPAPYVPPAYVPPPAYTPPPAARRAPRGGGRARLLPWLLFAAIVLTVFVLGVQKYVAQHPASVVATPSGVPSADDKRALVESYYAKISTKDYPGAYALLSDAWHAHESYPAFVDHYGRTARMTVDVLDPGAGTNSLTVHVNETKTDGTTADYWGSVTLAPEGTPPRWTITGRDLRTHTPAPAAQR